MPFVGLVSLSESVQDRRVSQTNMTAVAIRSPDIERASLHIYLPWYTYLYAIPFLSLYPLWAYAYYFRYDDWIKSEEWTFLECVCLGAGHALSFLVTKWGTGAKAWVETRTARSLEHANCIRIVPAKHRGKGEIVPLLKKDPADVSTYRFSYQRDMYICDASTSPPSLGVSTSEVETLQALYGKNEFKIPIPSFTALFGEHATAPFFVFQIFCVALWCLDEYWYFSLFTLFMLVVFECTVAFQRVRTLTEFRTMSITPYPIQCRRDNTWITVQTDELVPGDLVSVVHANTETAIPADLLLLRGTCIVNEAMLSGESTPLLKESIELREVDERLDVEGVTKGSVLFSGTKVLQAGGADTPDKGALALVLRTGFGTAQGQLVRTMIFSTDRVSANNFESFLFIGFLLIFAIAASWYVWVKGIERGLKKSKLLLDCVLIITSVVPPELRMELSLAVNASLVALSKFGWVGVSAITQAQTAPRTADELFWMNDRTWSRPLGFVRAVIIIIKNRIRVSLMFLVFGFICIVALATPETLSRAYLVGLVNMTAENNTFTPIEFSPQALYTVDQDTQIGLGLGSWAADLSIFDANEFSAYIPEDETEDHDDFFFSGYIYDEENIKLPGLRLQGGCVNFSDNAAEQGATPTSIHTVFSGPDSNSTAYIFLQTTDGTSETKGMVKCTSSFSIGSASLSGGDGTYNSFLRDLTYDVPVHIADPLSAVLGGISNGTVGNRTFESGSILVKQVGYDVTSIDGNISQPSFDIFAEQIWLGVTHMTVGIGLLSSAPSNMSYPVTDLESGRLRSNSFVIWGGYRPSTDSELGSRVAVREYQKRRSWWEDPPQPSEFSDGGRTVSGLAV
ncbi:E1-E2 ATPase-domain-containing protein [Hysterangium stoloniferum]|nr:E1-E2 ATPase-domain-containing protein [Hysterangium stoloniferum]